MRGEQANNWTESTEKQLKTATKEDRKKLQRLEKQLARKDKALAEAAALLVLGKKARRDVRGPRGRLIGLEHRLTTVALIKAAVNTGARLYKACAVAHINVSTYRRWQESGVVLEDKRPDARRPTPGE